MITLGQIGLLLAFVGSGYAALACMLGWRSGHRGVRTSGVGAALIATLALTVTTAVLGCALVRRDFRFQYVTQYCDQLLPWQYALSALWVGQAGSLLVWAWFAAAVALAFRFWPGQQHGELREPAFALLMAYLCFLVAVMVFAADPMQASLSPTGRGDGLAPSLQHPAMLIHPPIVFLGYAAWGVPFALAVAALLQVPAPRATEDPTNPRHAPGQEADPSPGLRPGIDATWAKSARPWALFAWAVLGGGILIGAEWAYEELGWGGYWAWDPVENGSLIPWLTGTSLLHGLMTWRYVGALKKTTLALATATFGLCNFAAFLTRSGIFSSLHEFSRSPIGWLFLAWMLAPAAGGAGLIALRRSALTAPRSMTSVWSREAMVLLATIALVLLAAVTLAGTVAEPLSRHLAGQAFAVGQGFYNNLLIPTGLCLLATMAAAPLMRWGGAPTVAQRKALFFSASAAALLAVLAFALGLRHPIALAIAALAALATVTPLAALCLAAGQVTSLPDAGRFAAPSTSRPNLLLRPLLVLARQRRQYAGFLVHAGFVCLAIGVTGSSLGTRRHELLMSKGESVAWAGRSVRYVDLIERELPDRFVAEAELEVSQSDLAPYTLLPAQHLHRSQNAWSAVVAIHSTWNSDFYTILHGGRNHDSISLTFIENPMMRWLWLAGWVSALGAVLGLWPLRSRSAAPAASAGGHAALAGPHRAHAAKHRDASRR